MAKIRLTETNLRKIIKESIKRIIAESFSNMSNLYHLTSIDRFVNIVRTNTFFLQPSNHNRRGGKYYFSLTRHKSSMEGYNILSRLEDAEYAADSEVRINFDVQSLSHIHGIQIKPFDFYADGYGSTKGSKYYYNSLRGEELEYAAEDEYNEKFFDEHGMYPWEKDEYENENRNLHKKLVEHGHYHDDYYGHNHGNEMYDDTEYYNMAEENLVSDTIKEIPEIYKYIKYADVFMHIDIEDMYEPYAFDYDEETGESTPIRWKAQSESYDYAYALCKAAIGTPWENKIRVFLKRIDFVNERNPISLKDFASYIKNSSHYKDYSKNGRNILRRKTLTHDKIDTIYS